MTRSAPDQASPWPDVSSRKLQRIEQRRQRRVAVICLVVAATAALALSGTVPIGQARHAEVDFSDLGTAPGEEPRVKRSRPKPERAGGPPSLTLSGFEDMLAKLRGRIVVVNFWASWCGPCRAEAPGFAKMSRQFTKQDVFFLGINVNDDPYGAARFIHKFKIPYLNRSDVSGDIAHSRRINALPTTLVIGPNGRTLLRRVGAIDPKQLTADIVRLLPRSGNRRLHLPTGDGKGGDKL